MARIRHLAIWTEDTERLATFYTEVFGFEVLRRQARTGGKIFLTDGEFNLALLPNDGQNAPNGLYHFGIEVEDLDEVVRRIERLGLTRPPRGRTSDSPFAELRASDPDGNLFDVNAGSFLAVKPDAKP